MARKKSPKIKLVKRIKKGDIIDVVVSQKFPSTTGLGVFPDTEDFLREKPAVYLKELRITFNGREVGRMLMSAAVSANPKITLPLQVNEAGTLKVEFESNSGEVFSSTKEIKL